VFLDNFVGRTDGTVAGAFSGEDSNVAPVALMDRNGVRWSTSLVPPSVVWALSVGPDGREVVAATDAGAYRIDGDDGTAGQLPPVSLITPITYGAAIAGDGASYAIDIASWEVRARCGNGDAWWTARLGDRIDPRGLDIAPDGRLLVRGWYSDEDPVPRRYLGNALRSLHNAAWPPIQLHTQARCHPTTDRRFSSVKPTKTTRCSRAACSSGRGSRTVSSSRSPDRRCSRCLQKASRRWS
jgi:hypothetical protein